MKKKQIMTAVVVLAFLSLIISSVFVGGQSIKAPAAAPDNNTNQTAPNMQHLITIKTKLGDIEFATYDSDAPKTVQNFIDLANKGFYNGTIFHRTIPGFMIQGGDPTGTGSGGPGYTIVDELSPATPSYQAGYKKGVLAMANTGQPNTGGSQFFIMLADYSLPNTYTIFGKVVKGQEVVDAIGNAPTKPTGEKSTPVNPVKMDSVTAATYTP